MKLRQLARTFLKVGRIINIILIPLFALLLVIFTIVDIVAIGTAATAGYAASDPEMVAAVSALVGVLVSYILLLVCVIVALILNKKAGTIIENAKSKEEAKPGAIMAIVSGVLVTAFPIATGVLILCTKEEDWKQPLDQPAPAQVEEKPAEEPKEE